MPAGALITILGWFASHLIVFTLIGFAVIGFFVLDRQPLAQAPLAAEESVSVAPVSKRPPVEATAAVTTNPAGAMPEVAPAESKSPPARAPKLIGGSIPVYDLKNRPAPEGEGFRPGGVPAEPPMELPSDRESLLQNARRAFWNGQFEAAEAVYMDLIAQYPDDADIFGELGNLYEGMGQADLARDAFFEAGVRLRNAGERKKLSQVIEILKKSGDERYMSLSDP
ncbi:MAG: hypothetical protein KDI82_01705 [Gammaproteobacteria bacterium]|nr:hypothetical protein [Gammaproteobacteria bacterium]